MLAARTGGREEGALLDSIDSTSRFKSCTVTTHTGGIEYTRASLIPSSSLRAARMSNRLRLILSSGGLVTFFLCVRSASRCLMYSCVRLRVAMLARPEFDERGASAADTHAEWQSESHPAGVVRATVVDHKTPQDKERSYLRTPALTSGVTRRPCRAPGAARCAA